jgi:hypothetical protein
MLQTVFPSATLEHLCLIERVSYVKLDIFATMPPNLNALQTAQVSKTHQATLTATARLDLLAMFTVLIELHVLHVQLVFFVQLQ